MAAQYQRYEEFLDERIQASVRGVGAMFIKSAPFEREVRDRSLFEKCIPELRDLEALLGALGFRLSITLKEAS